MPDIIEGAKPTRMELLKLNKRVKLAEKGHKLLKEKRDALINEFLGIVDRVRETRRDAEESLEKAFNDLTTAQMLMGTGAVEDDSLVTSQDITIDMSTRNIMGVRVPLINAGEVTRDAFSRGYGVIGTSAALDQAAKSFENSLERIIRLAEVEETVKKLALEVEKTKRRVNALEYNIVPRLRETAKYIRMRLDEMERESFTRLKRIKAVMEQKAEAA